MTPRSHQPSGEASGERFTPRSGTPGAEPAPREGRDKREARLAETLAEIDACLRDGAELVALGGQRFADDWLVRRAARNIVTEFAESAGRLPDRFKDEHPDVSWRAISGMRNRVVHVYENADPEIVWNVLAVEFPTIGKDLDLA